MDVVRGRDRFRCRVAATRPGVGDFESAAVLSSAGGGVVSVVRTSTFASGCSFRTSSTIRVRCQRGWGDSTFVHAVERIERISVSVTGCVGSVSASDDGCSRCPAAGLLAAVPLFSGPFLVVPLSIRQVAPGISFFRRASARALDREFDRVVERDIEASLFRSQEVVVGDPHEFPAPVEDRLRRALLDLPALWLAG